MSEIPLYSDPDSHAIEKDSIVYPRLFQVLLYNDDYTTMEFVVDILIQVFHKKPEQATAVMLSVHKNGIGVAGVYPHDLAEAKVARTLHLARESGFPLRCTIREISA